jgi:hypothetical protein
VQRPSTSLALAAILLVACASDPADMPSGQAEVDDSHAAVVPNEYVGRLEVAVDQACRVHCCEATPA